MNCNNGIHYFDSPDKDSFCRCLLWKKREFNTLQGNQKIKSHQRNIYKDLKKCWAIERLAKPVVQMTKEGEVVAIFRGMAEAEIITGINHRNISLASRGIRHTTGGYRWEVA